MVFIKTTIPPGAYEIKSLKKEIKRIVIEEGLFIQANYPLTIKPDFSTLGSIIVVSPQVPTKSSMFADSIRDPSVSMLEHYMKKRNYCEILLKFYHLIIYL